MIIIIINIIGTCILKSVLNFTSIIKWTVFTKSLSISFFIFYFCIHSLWQFDAMWCLCAFRCAIAKYVCARFVLHRSIAFAGTNRRSLVPARKNTAAPVQHAFRMALAFVFFNLYDGYCYVYFLPQIKTNQTKIFIFIFVFWTKWFRWTFGTKD